MQFFNPETALLEALDKSDLRPFQKLRVRLALRFRPEARTEMLGAVQMHCVMEGMVSESGEIEAAINWQDLIDSLVKLLPAILQIISLFT